MRTSMSSRTSPATALMTSGPWWRFPRTDRSLHLRRFDRHLRPRQGSADPRAPPGGPGTQTEYVRQKLLCEEYLFAEYRSNGFPATTVPFSMVMGPNNLSADREQRMFQRLLLGRPVLIPGYGTSLSQIGHVDEARAYACSCCSRRPLGSATT